MNRKSYHVNIIIIPKYDFGHSGTDSQTHILKQREKSVCQHLQAFPADLRLATLKALAKGIKSFHLKNKNTRNLTIVSVELNKNFLLLSQKFTFYQLYKFRGSEA